MEEDTQIDKRSLPATKLPTDVQKRNRRTQGVRRGVKA
jgi:hypothetical protein